METSNYNIYIYIDAKTSLLIINFCLNESISKIIFHAGGKMGIEI